MKSCDNASVVVFYHKKGFIDIVRYILCPYFPSIHFECIGNKQSEKLISLAEDDKPLLFIYAFE